MQAWPKGWRYAVYALLLAALTGAAYWQVYQFEFSDYDDADYILKNEMVRRGLSWEGVRWALTTNYFSYWHPLTWLSHMFDCHFFGLKAGAHHVHNVVLHILAAWALMLGLGRLTEAPEKSAVVAAFFALHPLHVESVAWIAERKDVLSTLFWFLTLWAYAAYTERPGVRRYLFALFLFMLGLMSKPMLVTVPCVMLLLDFWPLRRLNLFPTVEKEGATGPGWRRWLHGLQTQSKVPLSRLLLEKVPFLLLAVGSSAITFLGVYTSDRMLGLESVPPALRLANVPISYVRYVAKMFLPENMVVLYPMPDHWALWQVIGSTFLLILLSLWVVLYARRAPYLLVGWLWYLGTLVPTIGLIPVGWQSIADRYTYVPLVGLFIMLAWGISAWLVQVPQRRWILGGATGVTCLLMMVGSMVQSRHWRNSETLFRHAVNVSTNNGIAQFNLAVILQKQERYSEAVPHLRETIRLQPRRDAAYNSLGYIHNLFGQSELATNVLWKGMAISPTNALIRANLGNSLLALGQTNAALEQYERALTLQPDLAEAHVQRGWILLRQGDLASGLGSYRQALSANPEWTLLKQELAWLLATLPDPSLRNASEALRLAGELVEASANPGPAIHLTLAAACAASGRIEDGKAAVQKAQQEARRLASRELTARAEAILQALEENRPYEETPGQYSRQLNR